MISTQGCSLQTVYLHQRPKARIFGMPHPFQSMFYDNAVLIPKLHHISHRGKGGKLKQFIQYLIVSFRLLLGCCHMSFLFCLLKQSLYYLIRYHRSTDTGKRIRTICPFGIHDSLCFRQKIPLFPIRSVLIRHLMMIGHDNPHSKLIGSRDLFCRRNSIIAGNKQPDTGFCRIPDQLFIDAITILYPVGNGSIHICPQKPQSPAQDMCGTYAVYIIIPYDPDLLF